MLQLCRSYHQIQVVSIRMKALQDAPATHGVRGSNLGLSSLTRIDPSLLFRDGV
jgi:hypothetical protein